MLKQRVVRFAITGVLNTAVHVVVATALIRLLHAAPALANGVAFCVATVFSFAMNTLWSFRQRLERRTFFRFLLVSLLGLPMSSGLAGLVDWLGFHYAFGIAAVVLVMPPVNFLLHNFWTYKKSQQHAESD